MLVAGCAATAWAGDDPFDFDLTEDAARHGSAWQVGGFVELGGRYFTTLNDWLSRRLFAQTHVKYTRGRWLAFADAAAERDASVARYRDPLRVELRETYLRYDGDGFDLTVGKHRVAWGTADGIGTIDRINAVDFRDPILNARTPSRRPSWLVRVRQSTPIGIVEAVWLPRGRDRKFAEAGSPWETPAQRSARRLSAVVDDPQEHEGGLRYLRYGRGFDWGVAVFDGFTDAPVASRIDGDVLRLLPAHGTRTRRSASRKARSAPNLPTRRPRARPRSATGRPLPDGTEPSSPTCM